MLRFILNRLMGAVIVLWVIVSASFFMMRCAPGGPFDEEKALSPNVEANKWTKFGMGDEVVSPVDGTIIKLGAITAGDEYEEDVLLAVVQDAQGVEHNVTMPSDGQVKVFTAELDKAIEAGERVAVIPKPLWDQYLTSLANYAQLDFGVTFTSDGARTVMEELAQAFPISMQLGLFSMFFALLFGISIGLIAGLKQNTLTDYTLMSGAMVGISIPTMVSGPILIAIFVLGLQWLPYGGWDPPPGSEWSAWQYRILPVITLGLVYTAYIARLTRGGMLEIIRSDYIRTARAKGLSERQVVTRHALKGAILPTVSFLGPAMAGIVTGSVVVERVFGIAGLSEYFITPALNRDYPMVIGVIVVYSAILVVLNLIVDIAYTFLDPRVSYDK